MRWKSTFLAFGLSVSDVRVLFMRMCCVPGMYMLILIPDNCSYSPFAACAYSFSVGTVPFSTCERKFRKIDLKIYTSKSNALHKYASTIKQTV